MFINSISRSACAYVKQRLVADVTYKFIQILSVTTQQRPVLLQPPAFWLSDITRFLFVRYYVCVEGP